MIHLRKSVVAIGVAAAATIAATLIAVPAFATDPVGTFTPTLVFAGTFDPFDVKAEKTGKWDLSLKSKGETNIRVSRVSFGANSSSGWHSHPGPNLLTVTIGTVIEYEGDDPSCTGTTYTVGDTFGDNGGSHVHLVRNVTGAPAEVMAIALYPQGVTPFTSSQPKPASCPANIL